MRRKLVITASLLLVVLVAFVAKSTDSINTSVTPNEEPGITRVDDVEIEWEYSCTAYAWTFDKDRTKPRRVRDAPYCCVLLRLINRSESKTYEFTGWSFGRNAPWAHDDLGNSCSAAYFLPGTRVYGGNGVRIPEKLTLGPKQWSYIAVPFERPGQSAKMLTFELPAKAFGLQGSFRIKGKIDAESRIEQPLGWTASIPIRTRVPHTPSAFTK